MPPAVDHLVLMAPSLEQGVAWCEATLGLTPGPGGEHPLMGTHNRLFNIGAPEFERAYFEIIALDPHATPQRAAGCQRWFDMDDPSLRQRIAAHGPQLIHWVARVPDVQAAAAALAALGLDVGEVLQASRATPSGPLHWRITVRRDGRRLLDGCLPTLIQWGLTHPTTSMPARGAALAALRLQHPQADLLREALSVIGLKHVDVSVGPPSIFTTLRTPLGRVSLSSC